MKGSGGGTPRHQQLYHNQNIFYWKIYCLQARLVHLSARKIYRLGAVKGLLIMLNPSLIKRPWLSPCVVDGR